jgi:DnaD/phage-associated family protein
MVFKGFSGGKAHFTRVPEAFFSDLLPKIDYLGELKVTLYALWRLEHMDAPVRYLVEANFIEDERFMQGMGSTPEEAEAALKESLARGLDRATFLKVTLPRDQEEQDYYFLNTPKGRAAVRAIQAGEWHPRDEIDPAAVMRPAPPNVFQLYEEHIGPLSPMIAESLRDAEAIYPAAWLEEAIRIAVENNARSWRYVETILRRWEEEGRYEREDRRDSEEDRRKYVEGKYADSIE